ncbi:MAG: tetratricopeptide repeat protein [Candidatus Binatia bacterium]|nr:tetratricopeptide repeat protein [Candidatus Binatia bacterium]
MRLIPGAALLVVLSLVAIAPEALGQEQHPLYEEWRTAMQDYLKDPDAGADAVIELSRQGLTGLPAPPIALVGDVHLRRGDYASARKMFERALEAPGAEGPAPGDSNLNDYVYFGLGMAHAASGQLEEARVAFGRATEAPTELGQFARLADAQIAIASGAPAEASVAVSKLVELDHLPPSVQLMAEAVLGNALMAEGKYVEAAELYDGMATGAGGADARYAAALARLYAGEREEGIAALSALVEECPPEEGGSSSPSLRAREMEPRAVLTAWVGQYGQAGWFDQESLSNVLSLGGCSLAAATLENVDEVIEAGRSRIAAPRIDLEAAKTEVQLEPLVRAAADIAANEAREAATATGPATQTDSSSSVPWGLIVLGFVVLVGAVVWMRRG